MRNFLTAALEEHKETEVLSMEEAEVLMDQANTDAVEVAAELTDVERIIEVTDALEDLAVIADGIDEASPSEVALIENSAQMAVAGTDIAPEEVVPALTEEPVNDAGEVITDPEAITPEGIATESYTGKKRVRMKVAAESYRDKARTLWEKIKSYLKGIWEKIENFFYTIFAAIPRMRSNLEVLKKAIADSKNKKTSVESLKFTDAIKAMSVNYVPCTNGTQLKNALDVLSDAGKFVFTTYADNTVKRGSIIAKAISGFEISKSGEALAKLRKELSDTSSNSSIPNKPLLGNKYLADKAYEDSSEDTDLNALSKLGKSKIELLTSAVPAKGVAKEFSFTMLTISEMESLVKEATSLLDMLEEYNRGSKKKAIQSARKAIADASDKAEKEMAKAKDTDKGMAAVEDNYRSMLNFNAAYTRWAQSPAMPMLQHTLSSIKTVTYVVSKCLTTYKEVA